MGLQKGKIVQLDALCGPQKDFNGTFTALIYFHTQTLHDPPKTSGDCQGGARTERFTTGRNVVTVEEKPCVTSERDRGNKREFNCLSEEQHL